MAVRCNRDWSSKLQRSIQVNDSTTPAIEVPTWLLKDESAALEDRFRFIILLRAC